MTKKGYNVLAVWLSPKHQDELGEGPGHFGSKLRRQLVEKSLSKQDRAPWLSCGSWESSQDTPPTEKQVRASLLGEFFRSVDQEETLKEKLAVFSVRRGERGPVNVAEWFVTTEVYCIPDPNRLFEPPVPSRGTQSHELAIRGALVRELLRFPLLRHQCLEGLMVPVAARLLLKPTRDEYEISKTDFDRILVAPQASEASSKEDMLFMARDALFDEVDKVLKHHPEFVSEGAIGSCSRNADFCLIDWVLYWGSMATLKNIPILRGVDLQTQKKREGRRDQIEVQIKGCCTCDNKHKCHLQRLFTDACNQRGPEIKAVERHLWRNSFLEDGLV